MLYMAASLSRTRSEAHSEPFTREKYSALSPPHLEARPVVHPEHTLHQVAQRVVPQIAAHVPDPSHETV